MLSHFQRRSFFVLVPVAAALGVGFMGCGSGEPPLADEDPVQATALRLAFPAKASRVLSEGEPLVESSRAFVRAPEAVRSKGSLSVTLPREGSKPIVLRAPTGLEVRVHQQEVEGEGELVGRTVAYRRAGGTSFWTVGQEGAEEWIQLDAGVVGADSPALSWEIEGGELRQHEDLVEILDEAGRAHFRVTAPVAYGEGNREVPVRLAVRDARIELYADAAEGEALLIDPVWTGTGAMATARVQHSTTLLANGRVLVVGGKSGASDSTALATSEIYDPATKTWTLAASIPTARRGHTATLLKDGTGRVLVVGGFLSSGASTPNTQLYSPATNSWSSAGNLSQTRGYHGAVALTDGGVMIAGGYAGVRLIAVEVYKDGSWSSAPTGMAGARQFPALAQLSDGNVLVIGGDSSSNPAPSKAVDLFNPSTRQRLTAPAQLNAGRSGHQAVVLADGKVLVTNGATAGTSSTVGEVYDPATNKWTNTGAMIGANRAGSAAVLLGGKALVIGGGASAAGALATTELYDPVANSWSAAPSMLGARRWFGDAAVLADGSVLVAGGEATGISKTAELLATGEGGSLGEACTTATDCDSGFCADGVCCDAACEDECHACSAQNGAPQDGTCSPLTGTSCDDGNACTKVDSCQAGVCVGGGAVVCGAPSQCQEAGVCQAATGTCTFTNKADGTTCDDGNASTFNDVCTGGVCAGVVDLCATVKCGGETQCKQAGECQPADGSCSYANKANGTRCDDGNASTVDDVCTDGVCAGVDLCATVVCTALDDCHHAGVCDPMTGTCSNPVKADGSLCLGGTCSGGICTPDEDLDAGVDASDPGDDPDAAMDAGDPGDDPDAATDAGDPGDDLDAATDAGDPGDDPDAATDAGDPGDDPDASTDAGDPGDDSGASTDAGDEEDASAPGEDADVPTDAGHDEDASTEGDGGSEDAGTDAGGDAGKRDGSSGDGDHEAPDADSVSQDSGCSCRAAGGGASPSSTGGGLAAFGLLGMLLARRRRLTPSRDA